MNPPAILKRKASVGIEHVQKRHHQLDALQRNNALGDYLDTLVVGDAPEQQISFDKIEQMVKSDTIYIDNDYDDDITPAERAQADEENGVILDRIEVFTDDLMSRLRKKRTLVKAPAASTNGPPPKVRTWNPFKSEEWNISSDELRTIESCAVYTTVLTMKEIWKRQEFVQVHHFRSSAMQSFPSENVGGATIIPCNKQTVLTWTCRDEELIASPLPKFRLVFMLTQVQQQPETWKLHDIWIVPADLVIVSK